MSGHVISASPVPDRAIAEAAENTERRRIIAEVTQPDRWIPGPAKPRLDATSLQVWRVDLSAPGPEEVALLSADELDRAAVMSHEAAERWKPARGVLRALLGRYLDRDPRSLHFALGPHGKPALADDRAPLHFNLSHSGTLALYAFTERCEVGIDVQVARPRHSRAPLDDRGRCDREGAGWSPADRLALAGRAFGPSAAGRLGELAPAEREREFLRLWTCHEARLKCLGTGLGRGHGQAVDPGVDAGGMWIAQLDLGAEPHATEPTVTVPAAAVATQRAPRRLCCWEWPPAR